VRKALSTSEQKKHAKIVLEPTRIYVKNVLPVVEKFDVHGMAHNTGGAFYEKLTKCLPDKLAFRITKGTWPIPEIFTLIQKKAVIAEKELYRTFNMGIGYIIVVNKKDVDGVRQTLLKTGMPSFIVGEVVKRGTEKMELVG
jgi:phosphoribosylformylglycinamidine cyclo-ligase